MANAPNYIPAFSFSDWQNLNPSDPLPGNNVDIEFTNIAGSVNQVNLNLQKIQNSDGSVKRVIGIDQLKSEIDFGLNSTVNWAPGEAYLVRDGVYYGNDVYRCIEAHTSTSFSVDLAAGKWEVVVLIGSIAQPYLDQTEDARDDAQLAASQAAASAAQLQGTSATSNAIGTGSKSFTTQSGKFFANQFLLIYSAANAANYFYGRSSSYTGTALTVNVTDTGGSGTFTDWVIMVSGAKGAQGTPGAAGAGTGDMLKSENLSGLANYPTARTNMALGSGDNVTHNALLLNANTNQIVLDADGTNKGTVSIATLSANRTWAFPNAAGTVALTTDVAAAQTAAEVYTDAEVAAAVVDLEAQIAANESGMVLLDEKTASESAEIVFNSFASDDFADYIIKLENVVIPNNQYLVFRTSTDGVTYNSAAASYQEAYQRIFSSSVDGLNQDLTQVYTMYNLSSGAPVNGRVTLEDPKSATSMSGGEILTRFVGSFQLVETRGSWIRTTSQTIAALKFYSTSGNITSGKFRLYGLRK